MSDPNSVMALTLLVIAGMLIAMLQETIGAEVVMLCGLLMLTIAGVIPPSDAVKGFSDPAVITIGALFVVGEGLRATGGVEFLAKILLGRNTRRTSLLRLLAPVAALSAFMNNTTLVAFFLPIFVDIARRQRISPGQLLIPLSYASILGGTVTKIGTSTNLTVNGLMQSHGVAELGMFELAWVGVPVSLIGLLYLATIGRRSLPDRQDLLERLEQNPRAYTAEMQVAEGCPLISQSVRQSGLRDLPGLYLYRIEREAEVITPVAPEEILRVGDLLVFSGVVSTVVDLRKIRGLVPAEHRDDSSITSLDSLEGVPPTAPPPKPKRMHRQLAEVVIGQRSPLVGQTVKDVDFRERYNASIIAVHRSGQKIEQKIGQIELEPGDTLLVDTDEDFPKRWRNSPDFILVSGVEDSRPVAHERTWVSIVIFILTVVAMTQFSSYTAIAALTGATLMVLTGCAVGNSIYRSVDLTTLILVGASYGVSKAMDASGAAEWLANLLLSGAQPFGPVGVLAAIVIVTGLMTELLSNNATAALMATFSLATASQMGVDPRPFLIAVTVTASYGFATPIGYQTNLMVMNPGGYRFVDYFKVGIPLDLVAWILTIIIVPLVWRF